MSEKITWTHVDRHVRRTLEDNGTIAFGETDAEVAMGYIAFLERSLKQTKFNLESEALRAGRLESELEKIQFKFRASKSVKQRLSKLEENIELIRRHLGLEL